MNAKRGIATTKSVVTPSILKDFVDVFFPGRHESFRLPTRSQNVLKPPNGYVAIYLKSFTLGNLRYPFPSFLLEVLKYFKCHMSLMHPLGIARIISFEVVCRAHGVEPSLILFRKLLSISAAGDWVTIANRPGIECIVKGGVDMRDWKDGFVFMDHRLFPPHCESLYEKARLKVQKKGFFGDPIPEDDVGEIYDVLVGEGFVVYQYPEGVLFRANLIPALAEGEEVFDDMSYLRFVKKGTKEVSQMPNPNVSAGGSVREGVGETAEVASRPPDVSQIIDVESLPAANKKRINMSPPGDFIGTRLKRARAAAASGRDKNDDIEEGNKKTRASNKRPKKAASTMDVPKTEFYESNWVFRTQIPKHTADEIRSMEPKEFLDLYDDDCDAHATMVSEMRLRFDRLVKALQESTHRESKMEEEFVGLKEKLAGLDDAASAVEVLKEKETQIKSQGTLLHARNEEVAKLKAEVQSISIEHAKLMSESQADKLLINDLSKQLQELRVDRNRVVSEYVPFVCRSLLAHSDVLKAIGEGISANRSEERAKVLEEFSQEGKVDLASRLDYKVDASQKVEEAAKDWEDAKFPVIASFAAHPDLTVDQLLALEI